MISKVFLLFIVLTNIVFCNAQSSGPSKEQLYRLFGESVRQDSKKTIQTHSNPWVICNEDSAYFKKDTLTLYHPAKNYPSCRSNGYACWTFYRKNAFVLTFEYTDEPARVSATHKGSWYKVKLLEKKEGLVLHAKNNNGEIIQFRIGMAGENLVLHRMP